MRNEPRSWSRLGLVVGVVAGTFGGMTVSTVSGANRFYVENRSLPVEATGQQIPILADLDQDTFAFSVYLKFDASKIRIVQVALGAAVSPLGPEYNEGTVSNVTGSLVHGVVFDLSDPITKKIAPGTARELLVLTVDVLASTDTTVRIDLVNEPGPPSKLNVMTNGNGDSVSPAPAIQDGTLTITDVRPQIQSFVSNSGVAGDSFFVVGQNFNVSGFRISVCGTEVTDATILGDGQTVDLTAPACEQTGWTEVEVCTDLGCDAEAQGFFYENAGPDIQSINNNTGTAGKLFFVVGQRFDVSGFRVEVCGKAAEATLLGDGQSVQVIAPDCETSGWAPVRACTDEGCDTMPQGFFYESVATEFRRGDANDDGTIDISDGISILGDLFLGVPALAPCTDALDSNDDGTIDITDGIFLLGFLFQGGDPIPPPYPDLGIDPTADTLPGC